MRARRSAVAILLFALALAALPPGAAATELHESQKGNPFHILGHLLAPVGHLYGFLIVEPFHYVINAVPQIFSLD